MGDYPIKHARSPMELTDQIFGPATQHEVLQDEIYCQIMRQMTGNHSRCSISVNLCILRDLHWVKSQHVQSSVCFFSLPVRISLDRGWQLLWLLTGLFPPSPSLMGHTQRFLETRPRDQLSNACLQRLLVIRRSETKVIDFTWRDVYRSRGWSLVFRSKSAPTTKKSFWNFEKLVQITYWIWPT